MRIRIRILNTDNACIYLGLPRLESGTSELWLVYDNFVLIPLYKVYVQSKRGILESSLEIQREIEGKHWESIFQCLKPKSRILNSLDRSFTPPDRLI